MMAFDLVYTAEAVDLFGYRFNMDLAYAQLQILAIPKQINAMICIALILNLNNLLMRPKYCHIKEDIRSLLKLATFRKNKKHICLK